MKNIFLFLCGVGTLWLCSCSEVTRSNASETAKNPTAPKIEATYIFELKSVAPDKNHLAMGKFLFRHSQNKPVILYGFSLVDDEGKQSEDGNVFRVRFETFKRKESGQWADVLALYCGTGLRLYPIQPNQDYTFLIPLWPFVEKGTHGIVGVNGTGTGVESRPFETTEIQKIAKQQEAVNK